MDMHIMMDRKDYKISKKPKWVLQAIHISVKPIFLASILVQKY